MASIEPRSYEHGNDLAQSVLGVKEIASIEPRSYEHGNPEAGLSKPGQAGWLQLSHVLMNMETLQTGLTVETLSGLLQLSHVLMNMETMRATWDSRPDG